MTQRLAALGAVLLRCNLPLSVGLVWLTNPLTIPAIFYIAYQVGALVIDVPVKEVEFEISFEWLQTGLTMVWKPLVVRVNRPSFSVSLRQCVVGELAQFPPHRREFGPRLQLVFGVSGRK